MLHSVIDQFLIDLINDDKQIAPHNQFTKLAQVCFHIDGPCWIVGRTDDDRLCLGCDCSFNSFKVQRPVRTTGHSHRDGAGQLHNIRVANPAGRGHNHLVSPAAQRQNRVADCLLGAVSHTNFIHGIVQMIVHSQFAGNGGPQLRDTVSQGIFCKAIRDGLDPRPLNVYRCDKVRLPYIEGNDLSAGPSKLIQPSADGNGGRFVELAQPV